MRIGLMEGYLTDAKIAFNQRGWSAIVTKAERVFLSFAFAVLLSVPVRLSPTRRAGRHENEEGKGAR
jgi:hypothetical protein